MDGGCKLQTAAAAAEGWEEEEEEEPEEEVGCVEETCMTTHTRPCITC